MNLVVTTLLLARKDLWIELRSKVGLIASATFGASVLGIIGLAAGPDPAQLRILAPALTTIASLLGSILLAERLDAIDRQHDAFAGLWLSLSDRRALFLGRTIALTTLLSLLEMGLWLLAVVVLDAAGGTTLILVLPIVVLSAAACAAAATLVITIANNGDRHALALPVLLLPLLVPVLLATTNASTAVLGAEPGAALKWVVVLGAEAALFAGFGLLSYELVAAPE